MTAAPKPPRRILIGAGTYADARVAIRLTRQIAARSAAVVGGILVEETAWADLPRLKLQRVVTSGGQLVAPPSARQARRMFERDARAFEDELSGLAQTAGPLARRRGELAETVWAAAAGWDVLVLGYRAMQPLPGRVVLIQPPGEGAPEAAALADRLARGLGTSTITLGLGSPRADLPGERLPTEDALFDRLSRISCAAVVLDRAAGPFHTLDQLRRLLASARCPVVLLGAPPAPPSPTSRGG